MDTKFQNLKSSTKTIMVYCNLKFNLPVLFENLPITTIDVPLTKKKKLPNMKKVVAPAKAIISVRFGNKFRGIITKKVSSENGKEYFKNQVSCTISIGNKNLHIMIFNSSSKNSSIKIAGASTIEQSIDVMKILWEYVKVIEDSYKITEEPLKEDKTSTDLKEPLKEDKTLKESSPEPPTFIFDTVMSNVDFKLGFRIDRKKLNDVMNHSNYKDAIHMSMFESTSNPNVNIKFYCSKPDNLEYKRLTINKKGNKDVFKVDIVKENLYRDKKGKNSYTTFLVFGSSKVIESGRYEGSMMKSFDKFIEIIKEHKDEIEEKIEEITEYKE